MVRVAALAVWSAQAQTPPPAPAAPPDAAAVEEQVQQITVTAQRREQDQQKVAGVVQSLSGLQLRRDGIQKLEQLPLAVPGLSIANQEGNVEIFLRGVGSANNTELGDPAMAPHLNGIYIPRPRGLSLMFYDLERVEVNKGPQGTLYGRNAMAGTLNILTARARLGQRGGFVQAEAASGDTYAVEAAYNLPLGSTAALRLAGQAQKTDLGYRNVSVDPQARSLRPAGLGEHGGLRLSATWEPSETLRLTAMVDLGESTGTGSSAPNIHAAVIASGLRPEQLDLRDVVYRGHEGWMRHRLGGVQFAVNQVLGRVELDAAASYREVDFRQRNAGQDGVDWPGRDRAQAAYDNYTNQWWQTRSQSQTYELRLSTADPAVRLKWTTGLFHFAEDQQVGYLSLADRGYCCYSGTEFTMPEVNGQSTAVFGDGSFDLTPSWRVLGGVRHTTESKSRFGIGGNLALVLGGQDGSCCMATRWGTEGFAPSLLDRPQVDMSQVVTPAQQAQFLIDATRTPGLRDTLIAQIQAIADGSNPAGTCFTRPDIDNGFVRCPTDLPAATAGGFSFVSLTVPDAQRGRSRARYADFRIGVEHDLSREHLVYAKFSTGHKAGGFNDSFRSAPVPEVYGPERVGVLEAGSRQLVDVAGRRALLNLTGFVYSYTEQTFQDLTCIQADANATTPCTGYSLVNRNIGRSRIAGLEAEGRFLLGRTTALDLHLTWLDARITRGRVADVRAQDFSAGGVAPLIDLAGHRLPLASTINLSARVRQTQPWAQGQLSWQALLNYRSAYHLTQFNEAPVRRVDGSVQTALAAGFPDRQPGLATVNLSLGYAVAAWSIEAFVHNLTDVQASQKSLVGANLHVRFLNEARRLGLRARVDFRGL